LKFGPAPLESAVGAILAHAVRSGATLFKKGQVLGPAELAELARSGIESVIAARLEPGDIEENEAAARVARQLSGRRVAAGAAATGRVNLTATRAGLVIVEAELVDALNRITEDVTLATLHHLAPVKAGQMIATVKIIPFAVPEAALAACCDAAVTARIDVYPFRPISARLIQTVNDGLKPSVIEKTSRVTADRLSRLGGHLAGETHCRHDGATLAQAIAAELSHGPDLLLVIGASAIVDRRDVIPLAIETAGGRIDRLGMPVDPGNLILLGEIDGTPVLGLPGCARSPARNGLDWVLERLAAGIPPDAAAVARMGVGGLLIGGQEEKDYL
jgi:molybdenum cofactor cytidylyltransferase